MERKISKQRKWAIAKQAAGLCPLCGKDAKGMFYCRKCARKVNAGRKARRIYILGEIA